MDNDALLDAFLLHLKTERRLSGNTLSRTAPTCAASPPSSRTADRREGVSPAPTSSITSRRFGRRLSPFHRPHVSTLRSFFRFLVREGVLDASPVSEVKAPRLGRPLRNYLTLTECTGCCRARRAHS